MANFRVLEKKRVGECSEVVILDIDRYDENGLVGVYVEVRLSNENPVEFIEKTGEIEIWLSIDGYIIDEEGREISLNMEKHYGKVVKAGTEEISYIDFTTYLYGEFIPGRYVIKADLYRIGKNGIRKVYEYRFDKFIR